MDMLYEDQPCTSFRIFPNGTYAPYKDLEEPGNLAEHVLSLVAFNPPSLNAYAAVPFGQEPQHLPSHLIAGGLAV